MSEKDVLLNIENLTVEYTSAGDVIHAVNDISLELERGRVLGLVGETGAGKTTVAKSIPRILPMPPAIVKGGRVFFNGEDLMQKSEEEMLKYRGQKISMIFQDPMTALNPSMTIGDQVAEALMLHSSLSRQEAKEKTIEMLRQVGIMGDRYNNYPYQFSGGMKQRVVIAMALICGPELLLADEPTTALDVTIQAQILEMIRGFKEKNNTSMILITHDLGIVAENCDTVAVIYAGQILEYGTIEDIFDHPAHPYTKGLFNSLPGAAKGERRLHPIEGFPPDPRVIMPGCVFAPRCPYATDKCTEAPIADVRLSDTHRCRCILEEV